MYSAHPGGEIKDKIPYLERWFCFIGRYLDKVFTPVNSIHLEFESKTLKMLIGWIFHPPMSDVKWASWRIVLRTAKEDVQSLPGRSEPHRHRQEDFIRAFTQGRPGAWLQGNHLRSLQGGVCRRSDQQAGCQHQAEQVLFQ